MRIDILIKIRENPSLEHYLKYHSYWYKELRRNPDSIVLLKSKMEEEYKLTIPDKLEKINKRFTMIEELLDVLS